MSGEPNIESVFRTLENVFEFVELDETFVRKVVKTSMYQSEWNCSNFSGKFEYQVVLSPVIIRETDRHSQEVLFNIAKTSFHLLLENNNNSSSGEDRQCNNPVALTLRQQVKHSH